MRLDCGLVDLGGKVDTFAHRGYELSRGITSEENSRTVN